MKKTILILIAIAFIFCSNVANADVIVSGITIPENMNGVYIADGTFDGKPCFSRTVGMDVYQIFYYIDRWLIYIGTRPTSPMSMWAPDNKQHFYIMSNADFPPESGYSTFIPMSVMPDYTLTGDPIVSGPPAIPVSLWGIAVVFILAGGVLLLRQNIFRKAKPAHQK